MWIAFRAYKSSLRADAVRSSKTMALFRKFFYRKPPDGLLEISEGVYVFDYCFTTDVMEEDEYKVYIGGIVGQFRDHLPDASFMVFNFRERTESKPDR
ncbi:Formin-like protein [Quillaja saponaria]|uniref:Formin-like protein n=1 Tax=Quillaja saponaria TaxID=32244 RepID=A0AAD7LHW4_QUISA|nr:Formin-like protein [Quillaja saponaria]